MAIYANSLQLSECIADAVKAKVVPFIKGSPGIGKSAIVKAFAKQYGLYLIDLRLSQVDPCDLLGFPNINKEAGRSGYMPMDTFPLEGDKIPDGYNGWCLFLDELPGAEPAVQKAAYKLILDRLVGNRALHERVVIVAAGNLETDNAFVEDLSTALQSRLVHLYMQVDSQAWLEWAVHNNIHHYITDYIRQFPDKLYTFKPDHQEDTYASPRTWEFASRFLHQRGHDLNDHILRLNLSGTLSEGVAREFLNATRIYGNIPTLQEIEANPTGTKVPEERSLIWAMTGSLANWIKESNADPLLQYVERMPIEFQIICLQEIVARKPNLKASGAVARWFMKNAPELYEIK